jgi:hypothetical protein
MFKLWNHSLLPDWDSRWWDWDGYFVLNGEKYKMFCHNYNCGWPPARMTERSVEMALADHWLREHEEDAIEVGAVTPYYWPRRVKHVVDPYDEHALVSHRDSLFNTSLEGRPVLSISTIEHIGIEEYGQKEDPHLTILALQKILAESPAFLVTAPLGYNKILDSYLFSEYINFTNVKTSFLAREVRDNAWSQVDQSVAAGVPYGSRDYTKPRSCANAIVILAREC